MKKVVSPSGRSKAIIFSILGTLAVIFIVFPLLGLVFLDGNQFGNVALIPINGPITGNGQNYLGTGTVSSENMVQFVKEADENIQVKVILLEINSPGGSAVASDEIANAVKRAKKPVVALIREVGASGGYWVASSADYVIANRMSITGSIGVISSYLEFSGLMDKYGVGYERLVAGKYKDIGTPYQRLDDEEKIILQKKLDKIHDFFIQEIAKNRKLPENKVQAIATGEFFLGEEAMNLGLVDKLGDKLIAEEYLKQTYDLDEIEYITYETQETFFDLLTGVFSHFFFNIGEGFGSMLIKESNSRLVV